MAVETIFFKVRQFVCTLFEEPRVPDVNESGYVCMLKTKLDYCSKMVDPDGWIFNSAYFHKLDLFIWGPHSVDSFPSYNSRQLPRYCSKWWYPGEVIDVFTVDWCEENNYPG